MEMTRSISAAMTMLAVAITPGTANAEETKMPGYEQAMACAGYYTVLHFYMNDKNPGAKQTLEYKGYATDWVKLGALLRQPGDDLEKDFAAKQEDADDLIRNNDRVAELKQVQNYCMTNGIARFKWDQK